MNMHFIIDRFLDDDLSDGESAEFEERLLWDHALLREVELAEFQDKELRRSVTEDRYDAGQETISFTDRLTKIFAVPQFAAAASFALATVLIVSLSQMPFSPGQDDLPSMYASTEVIPLFATRSDETRSVGFDRNSWTVLLIDAAGSYDAYRVKIMSTVDNSEPLWSSDDMQPDFQESLVVGLPGNLLDDGPHVLTIEGLVVDATGTRSHVHVQNIEFEVSTAP